MPFRYQPADSGGVTCDTYEPQEFGKMFLDGLTETHEPIQEALNEAGKKGGEVCLPKSGNLLLGETLEVPEFVTLRGQGVRRPKLFTSHTDAAIRVTGIGASIHDLLLDPAGFFGGSTTGTGRGIEVLGNFPWSKFYDVEIVSRGESFFVSPVTQLSGFMLQNVIAFRAGSSGTAIDLRNIRNSSLQGVKTFTAGPGASETNLLEDSDCFGLTHIGVQLAKGSHVCDGESCTFTACVISETLTLAANSFRCTVVGNFVANGVTDNGTANQVLGNSP